MSIRYRIVLPSLAVALLLLASLLTFAYNAFVIVEAEESESDSIEILLLAEHWFSDLQAMEYARYKYLNTGNEAYLAPSANNFSHAEASSHLAALRTAAATHFPDLLPQIDGMAAMQVEHFARTDAAIALRRNAVLSEAQLAAFSAQGDRFLERLRLSMGSLADPVQLRRDQANLKVADSVVYGSFSFAVMVLLMIAILGAGYVVTVRMLRTNEEGRAKLRGIIDNALDAVVVMDAKGIINDWNSKAEKVFGWSHDEAVGRVLHEIIVPPAYREHHIDGLQRFLATGEGRVINTRVEIQGLHRDGHEFQIELAISPVRIGGQYEFSAFVRDITERKRIDDSLRKSEAKLAAIFDLSPDPAAVIRLHDGVLLSVSNSFAAFAGYDAEAMIGQSILPAGMAIWVDGDDGARWVRRLDQGRELIGYETTFRRQDGTDRKVSLSARILDIDGAPAAVMIVRDITEQKRHEVHLEQIAYYDGLTHLPNRRLLADRLQHSIAQNQRSGTMLAVCYLDLDGFKPVNDTLGHAAGDQLLVEVAARLKAVVRGGDTVARLGGDEFVLLLSGLTQDDEYKHILDRLLKTTAAPYTIGDSLQESISASIGVALFPRDHTAPDTLLRYADQAMYVAKQGGKNRYQLFDSDIERRIEARNENLRRIAAALDNGQCCLFYQPKVDCRSGLVVGAEALIRWDNPVLGLLLPSEFLPLVEDDDLALVVGSWVIRSALRQLDAWRRQDLDIEVSVNVFIRQLQDEDFPAVLGTLLAEYPTVPPQRLTIEIIESSALKDLDAVSRIVTACQALGVRFAIDDFGTGYSSLLYLRHLPVEEIKIDRSFVGGMLTDSEDLAIVQGVIGLGDAFRRTVVAEGVETAAQATHLARLGCGVMQGYLLAPPLRAAEFPAWVSAFRPDPAWWEDTQ